ncbi:hypothetical protein D039_4575A, partial [Vibrio parahaemolyticus EKP-028]
MHKSCILL